MLDSPGSMFLELVISVVVYAVFRWAKSMRM
jgi:hypothetical protein